jgi:hypothetical protein
MPADDQEYSTQPVVVSNRISSMRLNELLDELGLPVEGESDEDRRQRLHVRRLASAWVLLVDMEGPVGARRAMERMEVSASRFSVVV